MHACVLFFCGTLKFLKSCSKMTFKDYTSKYKWCFKWLILLKLSSLCFFYWNWNRSWVSTKWIDEASLVVYENSLLVDTPGCKIWDMSPYYKDVFPFLEQVKIPTCEAPIVVIEDEKLVYNRKSNPWAGWTCCFRNIVRISQSLENYTEDADKLIEINETCIPIPLKGLRMEHEFVQTECRNENEETVIDLLAQPLKPSHQSKRTGEVVKYWNQRLKQSRPVQEEPTAKNTSDELKLESLPPNVQIIAIDTVSRLSMIRNLRRTRRYLLANDFVELQGYMRMGLNTFPNAMAFLCGFPNFDEEGVASDFDRVGVTPDLCWNRSRGDSFDKCPFIWNQFSRSRYVTSFIEDTPDLGLFNFLKTGFVLPPVDYFLRPFTLAYAKKLEESGDCVSGGTETDLLMKYTNDFVSSVNGIVPYFLLTWFVSTAHDDLNNLRNYDTKFQNLISNAVEAGDNTIIFFISDHGYRFGEFRQTFLGYYEESLPFFFVRLPPSVKSGFPDWSTQLEENSKRLLSPLDFHATLQQIFETFAKDPSEKPSKTKTKYFSFFEPVPTNRTCEDASIPNIYCRCGASPEFSSATSSDNSEAILVTSKVNEILGDKVASGLCARLSFKNELYVLKVGNGEFQDQFGKTVNYTDKLVGVETNPVDAQFEAKVRTFESNGKMAVIGHISRTNSYKGQDECMNEYHLKEYCACAS